MQQVTRHANGRVHELGLAAARAYHIHGLHEIGRFHHGRVPQGQCGLDILHPGLYFHDDHFIVVAGILAVRSESSDGKGLPGVTGKGFLMGHAGIGAEFRVADEQEAGQLVGFLTGDAAFLDVLLVERIHELAEAARRVGAAHLFDFHQQVREPVRLNGLAEIAGGMFGNPAADFSGFQQLGFPWRPFLRTGRHSGAPT